MTNTITDRALALAGVFNAAALVDEVAYRAEPDAATLDAALAPLFRFDAPDTAAVFDGSANLQRGLAALIRAFEAPRAAGDELTVRYALGLLHFERLYSADAAMQRELKTLLRRAQLQADANGIGGEAVIATLAEGWSKTLGQIRPRILVNGEPQRLREPRNVALIRALLLAGLRSAVLWRQVGGSRWSLLFSRGALRREAERLREASAAPAERL
jgi:high frequency lysogenization protein